MKTWIAMMVFFTACQTAPRPTTNATGVAAATTAGEGVPAGAVSALAARRTQLIGWLREYYETGAYPTDELGRPASMFRDARGVRCPMAELIHRSGHADLVDAVARENNLVRLADVKEGPLHDWMLGSGLTGDEIAMVQGVMAVHYDWMQDVQLENQTILARGQVRGRIETAVRALTDSTQHSLDVAAARLPQGRVPAVAAVTGKVLPEAALASGPPVVAEPLAGAAAQPSQLRLVRVGRSYQVVGGD